MSQTLRVTTPSNFKHFSNLPFELRLKIWTYAFPDRIIEFCQVVHDGTMRFYSPTPTPSLLRVNHESRMATIEHYILSIPNDLCLTKIYFNSTRDMLFLPAWNWISVDQCFGSTLPKEMSLMIRHIAIEEMVWLSHWSGLIEDDVLEIHEFRNLEEVVVVVRDPGFPCVCFWPVFEGPEKGGLEFVEAEGVEDGSCETVIENVRYYFEGLIRDDSGRELPVVKVMRAKRDGVLI